MYDDGAAAELMRSKAKYHAAAMTTQQRATNDCDTREIQGLSEREREILLFAVRVFQYGLYNLFLKSCRT